MNCSCNTKVNIGLIYYIYKWIYTMYNNRAALSKETRKINKQNTNHVYIVASVVARQHRFAFTYEKYKKKYQIDE